jgi:S1-C subfamily serine protease
LEAVVRKASRAWHAAAAVLCSAKGLLLATGCGGTSGSAAPNTTATGNSSLTSATASTGVPAVSFPDLIDRIRSGVVRIEVRACDHKEIGTGILLDSHHVATVEHVVDAAGVIQIKRGGKLLATATVVGTDKARDLSLLRTSTPISGYRFQLTAREPRLGASIAALGYPLGLPLTVTRGSVSGLARTIPIDGVDRQRLIQTDAAVNPGNSGGPLIAVETGKVVGLVDLGTNQANGLAFAVSTQVARPLLDAWRASPQPVASASCAQPPTPPAAPSSDAAETAFARQVDAILALSASGRGDVGTIVTRVEQGDTYLDDGAAQMNGPITNRQEVLRRIESLTPPTSDAAAIALRLHTAIQASLDADTAYQTWMKNLPDDPEFNSSGRWQNADFDRAQNFSEQATRAKGTFTQQYNQFARRFGLRTWVAGSI